MNMVIRLSSELRSVNGSLLINFKRQTEYESRDELICWSKREREREIVEEEESSLEERERGFSCTLGYPASRFVKMNLE